MIILKGKVTSTVAIYLFKINKFMKILINIQNSRSDTDAQLKKWLWVSIEIDFLPQHIQ